MRTKYYHACMSRPVPRVMSEFIQVHDARAPFLRLCHAIKLRLCDSIFQTYRDMEIFD